MLKHDHVYHSPKRGQKSPQRTSKSSKYSSHAPRLTSPHNSRSTRKSSHARPKYSRSPPKSVHPKSRSSSPAKDSKATKKLSDSDSPGYSSVSKRKKSTKSPVKQYNPKVKLSETSLFAELVKDRQRRELAMKCLTQINTKPIDENEVVEIHDDSDTEQNNSKIVEPNTKPSKNSGDVVDSCVIVDITEKNGQISKPEVEIPCIKLVSSSILDIKPKISEENQSPIVTNEEIIENGIEHSLENRQPLTPSDKVKPEIIENKDFTKMPLPLPPSYPVHEEMSPDSEFKSSKKSIKDLPLPPGEFLKVLIW